MNYQLKVRKIQYKIKNKKQKKLHCKEMTKEGPNYWTNGETILQSRTLRQHHSQKRDEMTTVDKTLTKGWEYCQILRNGEQLLLSLVIYSWLMLLPWKSYIQISDKDQTNHHDIHFLTVENGIYFTIISIASLRVSLVETYITVISCQLENKYCTILVHTNWKFI